MPVKSYLVSVISSPCRHSSGRCQRTLTRMEVGCIYVIFVYFTGFKFNMTGTGEAWFNSIRIQNHLRNDHIKFDFIMTGMQWTSDTNKLCMEYRFHSNGKNDDPSSTKQSGDGDDAKDEAELDGAEFSSVKLAEQNNGTISHIQTRMMAKNGHILVQYDHFDTDVVHDPTLIANSGAWYLLPSALFAVLVLLF